MGGVASSSSLPSSPLLLLLLHAACPRLALSLAGLAPAGVAPKRGHVSSCGLWTHSPLGKGAYSTGKSRAQIGVSYQLKQATNRQKGHGYTTGHDTGHVERARGRARARARQTGKRAPRLTWQKQKVSQWGRLTTTMNKSHTETHTHNQTSGWALVRPKGVNKTRAGEL